MSENGMQTTGNIQAFSVTNELSQTSLFSTS